MSKTHRPNPHASALAARRWAATTPAERSASARAAAIARHTRHEAATPPIEVPLTQHLRYVEDVMGRMGAPAAGLPGTDPLEG